MNTRVRQVISYLGPGFLVTIGFIDPGNWATNVTAGAAYGYDLLWVITLSTLTLMLWQHIAAHLGIVTGKCLAEAAREHLSPVPVALYGLTAVAASRRDGAGGGVGSRDCTPGPVRPSSSPWGPWRPRW